MSGKYPKPLFPLKSVTCRNFERVPSQQSNRTLRLKGAPPNRMWTIMLSSQPGSQWFLNNRAVSENAITVYPTGYDFDNNFLPGYDCYTFYMSPEYFQKTCEDLEVPELVDI